MAKQKNTKLVAETAPSSAASSKLKIAQPTTAPASGKETEKAGQSAKTTGLPNTAQSSAMVASKPTGTTQTSFAGFFSSNRKLSSKNKLTKFVVEEGPLTLQSNDLVDGASFHQHDSGWLVFRFARDKDRQRILAGGPYSVYGRPLLLKNMPDCFEFKDNDISVTPVWAILPSLPLECWHPNALGKIGSRLGTPIAMDSLTMSMERVSYARILVKVDASKELVDQVEFVLPNGVTSKQPVVYEFTPKFCSECHCFGHLKDSCKGSLPPATAAATNATTTVQPVVPKKVQDSDWTLVKRRNRFPKHAQWQKQQQKQQPSAADRNDQDRQGLAQQQLPTPAVDSKMQAQPGLSGQDQISAGQGPVEQARRAVIEEHSPVDSSSCSSNSGSPSTSECIPPITLKQKLKLGGIAPLHSP
ncbi:hypothetical protein Salat_1143600 [Sesamum alatum]|uniref:DUF4283 domain-containing protein n=1 Tax=Sesamum alatum TaxID=300844 RepID=A0AAE1YDV2_9LAMI|nr:hypothetical protein Salat_1143600 [Sesamum alatum]